MYKFGPKNYCTPKRWNTYYSQLVYTDEVCVPGDNVLVVGPGDFIVPVILSHFKYNVDTLDIHNKDATYKGDVRNIESTIPDNRTYSAVLACEILEHIPVDDFEPTVKKLIDRTDKRLIVSVPIAGKEISKWHCWELGKGKTIEEIEQFLKQFGDVQVSVEMNQFCFFILDKKPL